MEAKPKHAYQLITIGAGEGKKQGGKIPILPIIRDQAHPIHRMNAIFMDAEMEIPEGGVLDESLVLFNRVIKKKIHGLQFNAMGSGVIVQHLGIAKIIPESGPIDVQLLGTLVYEQASRLHWIGADYGAARAFCRAQKNIPTEPHFDRLQFLFPGTIVFDHEEGICVPMVKNNGDEWLITHRNILGNTVPGVDVLVT
jgi:hypothetical protein